MPSSLLHSITKPFAATLFKKMLILAFEAKNVESLNCTFCEFFLAHCKLLDDDIRLWEVNTFRCPDWLFGNPWANQFTPIFPKFFDHLIYNQKVSWFSLSEKFWKRLLNSGWSIFFGWILNPYYEASDHVRHLISGQCMQKCSQFYRILDVLHGLRPH